MSEDLNALSVVLHDALEDGDTSGLHDALHDDVIWNDCSTKADVIAFIDAATDAGFAATDVAIEVTDDRLISCLSFGLGDEAHRSFQAVFVEDGKIIEIIESDSHEAARSVQRMDRASGDSGGGAEFNEIAPVLPVSDVAAALVHYERLGFTVHSYDGGAAYGYARRGSVQLHLQQVAKIDPKTNLCSVYLYLSDADATYLEWRAAGVEGRLVAPVDTDYGLREGAHIDPDGNLLRFGSAL